MAKKPTYEELVQRVKDLESEKIKAQIENVSLIKNSEGLAEIIDSETIPEGPFLEIDLGSLIGVDEIQSIMDDFCSLTGMVTAILDLNGKVIEATGWQDICTKFHRVNPQTSRNCTASDLFLAKNLKAGEYTDYKCKNGLTDVVTPLYVGTKHLGNIFTGQFFYDDEHIDEELFVKQAEKYGFDKKAYLEAFQKIPRYSRETINHLMSFLVKLTTYISRISLYNIQLKQEIQERQKAENAQKESGAILKSLIRAIPDLVWLKDKQGVYLFCNSRFESFFGATENDIVGKTDYDFVETDLADFFRKHDKSAMENAKSCKNEEEIVFATDGHREILETIKTPLYNNDGQISGVLGIGRDITERKQAGEALRTSEENLSVTLNSIGDGVISTDKNGLIVQMNPTAENLCGWKLADASGKPLSEVFRIVNSETRETVANPVKNVLESGEIAGLANHTDLISKNGSECQIADSAAPIKSKEGETLGVVLVFSDVTEKYAAQKQIKESEERYRGLLQNLEAGIVVHAPDTSVVMNNPRAAELLGLSDDQMKGKEAIDPAWRFVKEDNTPLPLEDYPVNRIVAGKKSIRDQILGIHRPELNDISWVTVNGFPMFDSTGVFLEIVISFIEITERRRVTQALRETVEDLKESQRIAHVGSWRLDILSNEVTWSDELYNMYGFDPSLPPPPYNEHRKLFTPDSWNRLSKALPKTIATGLPYELELETVRKDGGNGWMWVCGEAILDKKGAIFSLRGAAQDITERKFSENALKESKTFLDNLNDIAYMADTEGNVFWVNAAIEKIAYFPPEEVIGKSFLPLFVKEDHPTLVDVYKRTLGGESLSNKLTFTSGKTCYFTSLPRRNMTGDIVGTFGIARDITESQRAEEALRESEDRLRKAQAVAKIGSWEYDISTGKVWGSEEAFRIYGIERKTEFLPLDEVESSILDVKKVNQALVNLITKNQGYDIEFEVRPKNRESITVIRSIAELVYDASGNPGKVLGVIQDITNVKTEEEERVKLLGQLQQAQKMESVGRLAGGVAHDFNNMLGVILGHAEMIMEQLDPALPIYNDLEEIRKAAQRSADLTRQLLAFARKQTMAPKVLDLNRTLEGMLQMLRRLIGEDIDLLWLPGKDLAPVNMDPSQLDQMLANLCVNSRDAIADVGKITIETGTAVFDDDYCLVHPGFVPGEFVLLAVSDDGFGMDQETQLQIFEPFFTTKEQGKGTGLGLATIYGIVKQNNGFINVYSEPGQGTTFRIYLPRHIGKPVQIREAGPAKPDAQGHETILLVEDEPMILEMTTTMLERLGYTVVAANTPGEAIRLAGEYADHINLLMTDVVMPEMNGRDLAKNLLLLYPNLKRLFMSGYTANVIAHHGVLDKGVNFIQKPFSKKDLAVKVKEALNSESE